MKIYTRKGDDGKTSLLGGTRVDKYDLRIESYGTVDELNAAIGMLMDQPGTTPLHEELRRIQNELFLLGSHLANDPGASRFQLTEIPESSVEALEQSMDAMEAHLPPLKNFVLPGGHPANSAAHLARCICRRAERRVVELSRVSEVQEVIPRYLNRLSDWLFMASRYISHLTGAPEILWKP